MKIMNLFKTGILASATLLAVVACGSDFEPHRPQLPANGSGTETPGNPGQQVEKVTTLLDKTGWQENAIADGLVYYHYEGSEPISGSPQIINVLELDLTNKAYGLELRCNTSGIKCSDALRTTPNAVASVNAAYEHEAVYLKTNNFKISEVTLPSDHLRFWKHEGAIFWSNTTDLGMIFAGKNNADAIVTYKNDKHKNLVASAPMLIDNGEAVGLTFVDPSLTWDDFKNMDPEDYRRHQGVRHPRTAVALTEDRDLLLITVDGRWPGKAEGMNARELTEFLVHYFNPLYALNMDGGGSTTMCIKGLGDPTTHVINYPTDNEVFDHDGERPVNSHFVITKK